MVDPPPAKLPRLSAAADVAHATSSGAIGCTAAATAAATAAGASARGAPPVGGEGGEVSTTPPPLSKLPHHDPDADVAAAATAAASDANGEATAATEERAAAAAANGGGRTGDGGAVVAAVDSIGVGGGASDAAPAPPPAATPATDATVVTPPPPAAAARGKAVDSIGVGGGAAPPAATPATDATVVAPPPPASAARGKAGADPELTREAPVAAAYIVAVRKLPDGILELNGGRPLYDAAAIDRLEESARVVHPTAAAAATTPAVAPEALADGDTVAPAGGASEDDMAAATKGAIADGSGRSASGAANGESSARPRPAPGTKAAGFLLRNEAPVATQSNFLSKDLQVALRRRKALFPRTAEVLKTLAARPRDQYGAVLPSAVFEGLGTEPRAGRRVPDLTGKLYLAPLTTVGNTPFRRLCKGLGADITCGEMALAANLLQGQRSEWALLRRHSTEDLFGVQIAGNRKEVLARAAEVVARECAVDFVDLNCGCPLDMLTRRGAGAALMEAQSKLTDVVAAMSAVVDVPLSVKLRTGRDERRRVAHTLIPSLARAGASWFTVHGRTKTQRYSRLADWDYLTQSCAPAAAAAGASLIPNGDVYAWEQAAPYMAGGDHYGTAGVSAVMIARGALIKPWIFTECAQRRHWDISATERLSLVGDFARYGLDHWGADERGTEQTRKFLLEWLSFAYRYVPLGLLESPAGSAAVASASAAAAEAAAAAWGPRLHHRSPVLRGRSDLETLLASPRPADWVRISELVLGAAPQGFTFTPKHGSHAWAADAVLNG
ncbi:hypothetical protein MMPV_005650 [Pyropia vietnamensis]